MTNLDETIFFVDPEYRPRYYQYPVFEARQKGIKRIVLVWHRRAGKDKTCWELALSEAFKTPGNYWYMFPEYEQGRKAFWESIDGNGKRIISYIPESLYFTKYIKKGYSEQEMKIHLKTYENVSGKDPNSYSTIQIVGADKPDSLRGSNPKGVICSEYAEFSKPSVFDAIIEPALLENDGWCLFNFTSKGRNAAYNLYKAAEKDPNWYTSNLNILQTAKQNKQGEWIPVISPKQVEEIKLRGTVPEVTIQREYYNNFDAMDDNAYFQVEMNHATERGKINNYHYNPNLPLFTSWDLGVSDHTAIWFFQYNKENDTIYAIDYYEKTGGGIRHAARDVLEIAKKKGYIFTAHIGPHDVVRRDGGYALSLVEHAYQEGISFKDEANQIRKADKISIEERIEIGRKLIPHVCFDRLNADTGIERLRNYTKDFDEKLQMPKKTPKHDINSHGADAFMVFAVWWDRHKKDYQLKLNYNNQDFNSLSQEDYLQASGF